MQRTLLAITVLGFGACLPLPKDAGEVDTDTQGSDGSGMGSVEGDSTGGAAPPMGPGIEGSLELGSSRVRLMIPTPSGIVAVLEPDPTQPGVDVVAWSPDLAVSWSTPLPEAVVADIDLLDDGRYLVAGASLIDGDLVATAWRLAAGGQLELSQTYPLESPLPSTIAAAERRQGEIFLAIQHGVERGTFLYASLDLVASAPFIWHEDIVRSGDAITPAGALIMEVEQVSGTSYFFEIEGNAAAGYALPGVSRIVGSGSGLRMVSFELDRISLWGYASDPALLSGFDVELPGLQPEGLLMARGSRVVVVDGEARVTEIDDVGAVVRQRTIEPLAGTQAVATAVTVGLDEAIYVAVHESGAETHVVHRLGAL